MLVACHVFDILFMGARTYLLAANICFIIDVNQVASKLFTRSQARELQYL